MVPTLYDKNKWYVKKYLPSYVYLNHENNPVVPYGNGFRTLKKKNEVWNENSVMETAVTAIISVSSFSLPSPKKLRNFFEKKAELNLVHLEFSSKQIYTVERNNIE